MVNIKALSFSYNQIPILEISHLEIKQGKHCLFLGDSGSGKTTLLHMLAGLLRPNKGVIEIAGTAITMLKTYEMDHFRGENIGLIFQKPHLIDALTITQNLLMAQYLGSLDQNKKKVEEKLEELNILHRKDAKVSEISLGEAQRVSIARAMLNKPKLILADEPTSSLDNKNCGKVLELLVNQAAKFDATLIITTHDQRIKDMFQHHFTLD